MFLLANLLSDVVDHEMFEISGDINKMILGSFEPSIDAQDLYSEVESMVSKASSMSSGKSKDKKDGCSQDTLTRRSSNTPTLKGFLDTIEEKVHKRA